MRDYPLLLLGFAFAALGGEVFVRGAMNFAQALRVPAVIVASTIAAFVTSSPELAVAISAALSGNSPLALGDALGSNVVNVALILGVSLLIGTMTISRESSRREFPVAVLAPILLALLLVDGVFSRIDGGIALTAFAVWLWRVIRDGFAHRAQLRREKMDGRVLRGAVIRCLLGLGLLVLAGRLVVTGATAIAQDLGLSAFVIGATIVAFGTSIPELATAIVAKLRRQDDVALGTLVGSNIFNGLFIVGVAALIQPIEVGFGSVGVSLLIGVLAILAILPYRGQPLDRKRGALLLLLYGAYLLLMFNMGTS